MDEVEGHAHLYYCLSPYRMFTVELTGQALNKKDF